MIRWPDLKFPPINLISVWNMTQMVKHRGENLSSVRINKSTQQDKIDLMQEILRRR